MLACGHSGFASHRNAHDGLKESHPTCIIDNCCQVVNSPDLTGRIAHCTYFGKEAYKSECDNCPSICSHEKPSDIALAFFKQHPEEAFDEFYCGCHSWN